jgi:cytochrome P450
VDWLPFLDLLPEPLAPWRGKARRFYHEHISFWLAFYTQIKVRVEAGTAPECFMSKLLQENDIRSQLTDEEATGLMASLLSAGSETTATALKWFFKACTKYPDFIRSAQEEIDRVVGRERMPDWADRDKMPYLNAVIKELHRWSSLAPLAFQHATTGDDKYRGWNIPSGTVIVPNTYAIHHSVEFFPEHEKFIPERFLPPGDKRHAPGLARIDHHYNFGIGKHETWQHHIGSS